MNPLNLDREYRTGSMPPTILFYGEREKETEREWQQRKTSKKT